MSRESFFSSVPFRSFIDILSPLSRKKEGSVSIMKVEDRIRESFHRVSFRLRLLL